MAPPTGVNLAGDGGQDERTISPESERLAPLLGEEAQALISCNQKLQELGIGSTIKIPQICVVGDQSTGKSSLIEAISTIKVPKAKGLCTQCPLAIDLSSGPHPSSPWTCSVIIEEHYTFNESLLSKGVTKNHPFGPWQERTQMERIHVKTTHDKEEVCDLIRAAQAAILNPGSQHQDYLATDTRSTTSHMTKFSPNVIRLDVSEGLWPNLSFVDLPGVIANTGGDKDRYLVKMIQNLVQKYAKAERSVNMLTLPMTHDAENSKACAIIQNLNLEDRTLAVFTKADLADDDQKNCYIEKFFGEEDDLGFKHGYHFVVMPDNMDQEKAREQESAVFAQEPWSELDARCKARLGINALTVYLRRILFEKTRETLPGNLTAIAERLADVNKQLQSLPEPPNADVLPLQLQQSVTQFEGAMKMLFSGDATGREFSARMAWTQLTTEFKNAVGKARPTIFLESQDELTRLRKAQAKIKSFRNNPNAVTLSSDEDVALPPRVKTEGCQATQDFVHRFRLEEIRDINNRYYQASIPGEIELRAIGEMNRLSVSRWDSLLSNFLDESHELLKKHVDDVVHDVFDKYKHLELFSVIETFIAGFLEKALECERNSANEICRLEQEQPLTKQLATIQEKENQCLAECLSKRKARLLEIARAKLDAFEGVVKKRRDVDLTIPNPDPYITELTMSAKTRAYYEVAGPRFVDTICLGIFGRLLPTCTNGLVIDLKCHLGLEDFSKNDQIVKWMAEDPAREERRHRLMRENMKLAEGMRYIREVLGSEGNGESPSKRRRSASLEAASPVKTPLKRSRVTRATRLRIQDDENDDGDAIVSPTPRKKLSNTMRNMGLDD